jgi:non-ribosomal peptide synthetase component E (peptide arylation enzyme)
MGNEIETVVGLYGVVKAGLVPVCSIPNHRRHEVSSICAASGAQAHLFQADYRSYNLAGLSSELADDGAELKLRIVARGSAPGAVALDDLIESSDSAAARAAVEELQRLLDPERVGVFQLSGGTTGTPKVIPHTHASYLSAARRWAANLSWDDQAVNLHFLPLMHHAGLGTAMIPTHLTGGALVIARRVDPALIASLIREYRVTWTHLGFAALGPMLDHAMANDCDFSSVTHFAWTRIAPGLSSRAEALLGAVAVGTFGMSEGVHLSARRDDPPSIRLETVGAALGPDDEIVILDPPTGMPVPDGSVGELCFRGPSVIRSYFRAPELQSTAFTADGFLRSGDLGRVVDRNGRRCITVEGRLKDQISRGGEKFMAQELEHLLVSHPSVQAVAAIGIPDRRLGERVGVFVVPAGGEPAPTKEVLCAHLDERGVAKFKWPEQVELVDELPCSEVGKVLKDVLRGWVTR